MLVVVEERVGLHCTPPHPTHKPVTACYCTLQVLAAVEDDGVPSHFDSHALVCCHFNLSHRPPVQVLTAVEDYGAVSHALAEAGLRIQPEACGLVHVPLVQQEVDDAQFEVRGGYQRQRGARRGCDEEQAPATNAHAANNLTGCTSAASLHPPVPATHTTQANEALLERLLAVDDVDAVYSTVAGLE